jgi:glycyl-tRNA synthetase beta chain
MPPFLNAQPKVIAAAGARVQQYLFERLNTFAWPSPTPTPDCIAAVLSISCTDLIDAMDRIVSLQRLSGQAGLLKAAKVIERTHNILKGSALRQTQVDPARLQEPLERRLWEVYSLHQEEIARLTRDRSYAEATTRFGDVFFEPLHEFFDRVLVNVPDEALQQNRLALMKAINTLYTDAIADLSKLTVLHREETT